jgi:hypothetical protein
MTGCDRNVATPYDADVEVVETFDGGIEKHEVRKAAGVLDGEEKRGADEHRTSNAQH